MRTINIVITTINIIIYAFCLYTDKSIVIYIDVNEYNINISNIIIIIGLISSINILFITLRTCTQYLLMTILQINICIIGILLYMHKLIIETTHVIKKQITKYIYMKKEWTISEKKQLIIDFIQKDKTLVYPYPHKNEIQLLYKNLNNYTIEQVRNKLDILNSTILKVEDLEFFNIIQTSIILNVLIVSTILIGGILIYKKMK